MESPNKKQKTPRSFEPDLKVIVRENEDGEGKEYNMNSVVLANNSSFVDMALSIDMSEKSSRTITFQASPKVFELAMRYLEDPREFSKASPDDMLQVVEFYHMYDFPMGLKLVDFKVSEDFVDLEVPEITNDNPSSESIRKLMLQLNAVKLQSLKMPVSIFDDSISGWSKLITSIVVAQQLNLPSTKQKAIDFLNNIFQMEPSELAYFQEQDIQEICPLLLESFDLIILPGCIENRTEEFVASPDFPKLFVQAVKNAMKENENENSTNASGTL